MCRHCSLPLRLGDNLCEPLERCLDCEFYRVQVSWNHFLVRWYHFTRNSRREEFYSFSLYRENDFLFLCFINALSDIELYEFIYFEFDSFVRVFICTSMFLLIMPILLFTDAIYTLVFFYPNLKSILFDLTTCKFLRTVFLSFYFNFYF